MLCVVDWTGLLEKFFKNWNFTNQKIFKIEILKLIFKN